MSGNPDGQHRTWHERAAQEALTALCGEDAPLIKQTIEKVVAEYGGAEWSSIDWYWIGRDFERLLAMEQYRKPEGS